MTSLWYWDTIVNSYLQQLCKEYGLITLDQPLIILKEWSNRSHYQNSTLILSRMVHEESKRLVDFLPLMLWTYKTSKRTSTQATHFFLGLWSWGSSPCWNCNPFSSILLASKISDFNSSICDVEVLEKRNEIQKRNSSLIMIKSVIYIRKLDLDLSWLEI